MNRKDCKILTHAFFPTEEKIKSAVAGLSKSLKKFDWDVTPLHGEKFVGLAQIKIYEVWKALKAGKGGRKYTLLVDTDCSAISDPETAFSYVEKYCKDKVLVSCAHEGAWPIRSWGPFMSKFTTPSGREEKYFIQLNTGVICAKTELLMHTLEIFINKVCACPDMCDQHAFYVGHNNRHKLGIETQIDGDSILSISMAELDCRQHFDITKNGVKRKNADFYPVFAHMNGYVKGHQGVRDDFHRWSGIEL